MSEETMEDDSSHYEVSLTAGQAFIAFVLLLLSLAASFAFGIMVGKGQVGERLVVRQEPAIVAEANLTPGSRDDRVVELGVNQNQTESQRAADETNAAAPSEPVIIDDPIPSSTDAASVGSLASGASPLVSPAPSEATRPNTIMETVTEPVPHYAQVLSSSDRRAAEDLAAKLIDAGFTSAYVERISGTGGMVHRVRVRFPNEQEARSAVEKLKTYVKGDVWVTKQ